MKIIPFAALMFCANLHLAYCPSNSVMYLPKSLPITKVLEAKSNYDPLIDAIFTFESSRNTNAHNDISGATGGLQITQILLDEYNSLNGKNYKLEEMYNFDKSKEVFLYYTNHDHWGNRVKPKSWEQMSKEWWGTDRLTEAYWGYIKEALNT
jgi:hypothetical protein